MGVLDSRGLLPASLSGVTPPSAANSIAVDAYLKQIGQGPSQEHPAFSWEDPIGHAWNIAVIRVLNQKFCTYVVQNGLPKLLQLLDSKSVTPSTTDVAKALDKARDIKKLILEELEHQQSRLHQGL